MDREAAIAEAALEACRAVWASEYDGDFDGECPNKAQWIEQEREALLPALAVLERHGFRWAPVQGSEG